MSQVGLILGKLDKVRQSSSRTWTARCPAHDDVGPSLSIRDDNGTILLNCFANCEKMDILDALGIKFEDLFPEPFERLKPLRRPFPAADVIECLSLETTVVLAIAHRASKGLPIVESDMSRLRVAMGRIEEGRRLANG